MVNMHLDIDQPLDLRLAEFRSDPEKMKCVNDFIDELVEKAQKDAEVRRNSNCKQKHKLMVPKGSECGQIVQKLQLALSHPESLQQFATVQIR